MSERTVVCLGALIGALVGGLGGFLLFSERGRALRDRLEPTVDDLRQEFGRFQRTLAKVGEMAGEGMRVVEEFNAARNQSQYRDDGTSH